MIYLLILTLNLVLLLIYRNEKRYWAVTVLLWTLLLSFFLTWRTYNDKKISQLDVSYWESADKNKQKNPKNWSGDENILKKLKKQKDYVNKYNSIFLNSILLQTILTFIAQIIGYKNTSSKTTYKWTSIAFGILLIVTVSLAILMAIVPTGPFF